MTSVPVIDLRPFDQVAIPQSDRGMRLKQRDYLPTGKIPVIDQGQSAVGGYTDDEKFTYTGELPVVLFGDHTRSVKLVRLPFAVGADGVKIFRPAADIEMKYLYYWLKAAPIPNRGYGRHYQYLRQLSVPVPSRGRQLKIVAEIEKQFSRLDEAVANLKRVKANLKRYKAAVFRSAIEGYLVPSEATVSTRRARTYETGGQLLQRILDDERQTLHGKHKHTNKRLFSGDAIEDLPEGWAWCTADQVSEKITDGEHISPRTQNAGVPLLSAKDVRETAVSFEDVKYVSQLDSEKCRARCDPRYGDILIVSRGATIGRSCLVNEDRKFCLMGSVILMRPHCYVDANYLLICLKAGSVLARLTDASGSTAQQAIYIRDIRPLQLPLPPLNEQVRIAAETARLLSIARRVEAEVDTNLRRAERMRQSILSVAFSHSNKRNHEEMAA